jgi:hypothetical protein
LFTGSAPSLLRFARGIFRLQIDRVVAEEERTYGRLLELRDLFHAIISPTPGLPSISNIVSMQSRRQR